MSQTKTQIDAYIDRRLGLKSPHNVIAYTLADRTADENLAIDYIMAKIFQVGGRWQYDDSNHTDYPFITTDLVAGQRDYSFTADGSGNLILDVYKVMVMNEAGRYEEIYPVDMSLKVAQRTSGMARTCKEQCLDMTKRLMVSFWTKYQLQIEQLGLKYL